MSKLTRPARLKSWQGKAEVLEVIDGDTFKVFVDLGFNIYARLNVRIADINAPELPSAQGFSASAFLKTLLPVGAVVTLDSKRLDLHGRAEAVVSLEDGRNVAQLMLDAMQAVRANDRGNI
jgi:endonuclease YncB( thermonuclease family)